MQILLDTNVLSETTRPSPNERVTYYLARGIPAYISALTLYELKNGAASLKEKNRREELLAWVASIREAYEAYILPMTADIAETAAVLRANAGKRGRVLHIEDAIIAATAIEHELTLVTRNISDFEVTSVALFNPWNEHP
jgi:predicted nucleic acid-binding protein